MRILIATVGTRGDLQPFLALAVGLKSAGHAVSLCTHERYRETIGDAGIDYAHMNDDVLELLDSPEGKAITENSTTIWRLIPIALRLLPKTKAMQARQMDDFWESIRAADPELLLYHPKAAGLHFAEKTGIPAILISLQPMFVPTGEWPAMLFPALPLGRAYNRWTFRLLEWFTKLGTGAMVAAWRRKNAMPAWNGRSLVRADGRPVPVLYAVSPTVLPAPADWPATAAIGGYCFAKSASDYSPPPELASFLEQGPPPVYIGFGSITGAHPARRTREILRALEITGLRAILAVGWGGIDLDIDLDSGGLPEHVLLIRAAPHDWLFERVAATVHHGGCGTTHTALRSGKPTLVCPFFGDQPYWGRQVARLGCGPQPIPAAKLNARRLAAALREMTTNAGMRERAAAVGQAIRGEDGVRNAVDFIEAMCSDA